MDTTPGKALVKKAGDSNKLYALHAPEVECSAKGKARKRYEVLVKTSIAVTNARTAGGQFIVGMQALPGNPYDGHTLTGQIAQVERPTGVPVKRAYVDGGYAPKVEDVDLSNFRWELTPLDVVGAGAPFLRNRFNALAVVDLRDSDPSPR